MTRSKKQLKTESKLLEDVFYLLGGQWAIMADLINLIRLQPEEPRAVELSGQIWLQIKMQTSTIEYIKENFAKAYGDQIGQALTDQEKEQKDESTAN